MRNPEHYVRAYLLLQKDLEELFDYVEPSDQNLNCYSYRTHELLLRACVEVEANCKAILLENGYPKPRDDMNRNDYIKIEKSHRLSEYQVRVPTWTGAAGMRTPFSAWGTGGAFAFHGGGGAADRVAQRSEHDAGTRHGADWEATCTA